MWLEDLGIYQSLHPLSCPELNKNLLYPDDLFGVSSGLGQAVYSSPLTAKNTEDYKKII